MEIQQHEDLRHRLHREHIERLHRMHLRIPRDILHVASCGPPPQPTLIPLTPAQKIIRIVAEYFGTTRSEILSARRDAKAVMPRHMAMYLIKKFTMMSLPEIGRRFNHRDHSSVLHAVKKFDRLREQDAQIDGELRNLEHRCRFELGVDE
jgi:Bacterial dnaA protein helix-turn-helix